MRRKIYYRRNTSEGRAVYEDLKKQEYEVVEWKEGLKTVITRPDGKDVTDEYDYEYIPREMCKKEVAEHLEVVRSCPMCGRETSLYLSEDEANRYCYYINYRFFCPGSERPAPHIQDLFPDRTNAERELMKTGYCYCCQELLFGQEKFLLTTEAEFSIEPEHLIAYNRADHDGYLWWNNWFPKKGTGGNQNMIKEMDQFSDYILEEQLGKGISDIPKLGNYYGAESSEDQEYRLYCEGDYCNYAVRLINRKKDYNVYIDVYEAEE